MSKAELVRAYLLALMAEMEQAREYRATGQWHVDICGCKGCQDLMLWQTLSWWQRLRAKLAY